MLGHQESPKIVCRAGTHVPKSHLVSEFDRFIYLLSMLGAGPLGVRTDTEKSSLGNSFTRALDLSAKRVGARGAHHGTWSGVRRGGRGLLPEMWCAARGAAGVLSRI